MPDWGAGYSNAANSLASMFFQAGQQKKADAAYEKRLEAQERARLAREKAARDAEPVFKGFDSKSGELVEISRDGSETRSKLPDNVAALMKEEEASKLSGLRTERDLNPLRVAGAKADLEGKSISNKNNSTFLSRDARDAAMRKRGLDMEERRTDSSIASTLLKDEYQTEANRRLKAGEPMPGREPRQREPSAADYKRIDEASAVLIDDPEASQGAMIIKQKFASGELSAVQALAALDSLKARSSSRATAGNVTGLDRVTAAGRYQRGQPQ